MAKSRITIIGLGLIGGSIGLALKKAKLETEIVGHDKNSETAKRAQKMGAVDKTDWNLPAACDGASMVILALPLDGIKDTLEVLKSVVVPGVLVTDTATTKVPVMEWARALPEGVQFIGGDPAISPRRAGDIHGIDAANADLFQGATYSLAASTSATPGAIETMTNFCSILGAKPYFIDAAEHDGLMAGIQHLPALLATALGAATIQSQGWRELAKVAGADFRIATELAPAEAGTAREQFLAHRTDLLRWVDTIQLRLTELRGMLERQDAEALEKLVDQLSKERDRWLSGTTGDIGPQMDMQSVQPSMGRLFLGSLADRTRKPKSG
jgi:prephenate dehydrogenase